MRIAFIAPRLSYSGAPKIIAWIANGMAKKGHDVIIVVAYKSKCEQPLDKKVKLVFLNKKQSKFWLYRNTIGMLRAVFGCRAIVKNNRPDVVISFLDTIGYFYIFLNRFFWKDPIICSERADPYSRRKFQIKVISSVMSKTDLVVFQTNGAKEFFNNKSSSLNDCVIPNPVVLSRSVYDAIKKRKLTDFSKNEEFKISSVGRLSLKQKRQDVLLKAVAGLKSHGMKVRLNIYGDGPDKQKIQKLIEDESLENYVHLMGQQDKIPLKIYDSDCFVLSSDYEGIPNALAEAMSIGIPCISTDCSPGGAKLLIRDGKNGFLVDRGDYGAIAEKVIWMKEHPRQNRMIGEKATKVAEQFSEENVLNIWEKEIEKVVEGQNGK